MRKLKLLNCIMCILTCLMGFSNDAMAHDVETEASYGGFFKGGIAYSIIGMNPPQVVLYGTTDEFNNIVQADLIDGVLIIDPTVEYEGVVYKIRHVKNITRQYGLVKLVIPDGIFDVVNISACPVLKELYIGTVVSLDGIENLPALETIEIAVPDNNDGPSITDCLNNVGISSWVASRGYNMQGNCLQNCARLESLDLTDFFREYNFDGNGGYTVLETIGNGNPNLLELKFPDYCYGNIFDVANECANLKRVYMPGNAWSGTKIKQCVTSSPMLEEIYCPSPTPLDVLARRWYEYNSMGLSGEDVYTSIGGSGVDYQNCKVYVPVGSVDAYREHPSWKLFANIIEYDFASLKEVESDISDFGIRVEGNSIVSDSGDFEVYDLAGKRCADHDLTSGVYIVRSSTGAILKVLVR